MSEIANARINTFGKSPKADFVSSSEQLITLTIGQLSDLITQAVEKAIQPLQDRVESLEATNTSQDEKMATLEATVNTLADNQFIQLRLIHELREGSKKELTPGLKDRADILRALVVANGGKMLLSSARQKMHLRKDQFSQMLKGCNFVEIKPLHSDKRKMVIILKDELV